MITPRLEIDLSKIRHNALVLVKKLKSRGIHVTGVTKISLGDAQIAKTLLQSGIKTLGDSRIENIEAMRRMNVSAPMTLIRSPMLSQVDRVVAHADVSFNTELDVISALSTTAVKARRMHGIVLMVELGDLREGIMPADLVKTVRETFRFPNIILKGIGTNLACRCGVLPDNRNMSELSELADTIDGTFGTVLEIVSGGNSGNLQWALSGGNTGRINDVRLGEAIFLGREPLHRTLIEGLYNDAITLVAEVIEMKKKPSQPWGETAQSAFGKCEPTEDKGTISQAILAIGQQDTDPDGLLLSPGIEILGASSDHLILNTGNHKLAIGDEIRFQPGYGALLRSMTSPFVTKVMKNYSIQERDTDNCENI